MKKKKKEKTLLEWAMHYVNDLDVSVIPLKPKSKEPAIPWKKYQKRKPTDEELKKWFRKGSKYNIGIVTGKISGIVVVDLDSPEAVKFAKDNNFFNTAVVRTGGKGKRYHLYYKRPKGRVRNKINIGNLGMDIKGDGGYVVAPPSIHPSGKEYIWIKEIEGEHHATC